MATDMGSRILLAYMLRMMSILASQTHRPAVHGGIVAVAAVGAIEVAPTANTTASATTSTSCKSAETHSDSNKYTSADGICSHRALENGSLQGRRWGTCFEGGATYMCGKSFARDNDLLGNVSACVSLHKVADGYYTEGWERARKKK